MITEQPFPWAQYGPTLQWCRVCGTTVWFPSGFKAGDEDKIRCEKHRRSNACAIEGCRRSTKASSDWFGLNLWLCAEHWRLGCPARSADRRVYHRIFRLGRRYGWNGALSRRYWRIWARMVARARARCAGDIDEAEIRRLFGWDEAA